MKIAVYYNLAFGGAKRVVQEHVKGLSEIGEEVDVYTIDRYHDAFDPGIHAHKEYRYSFSPKIIRLPFFNRVKHDLDTFFPLKNLHKKIASDIDKKNYDVVLVHTDTLTQSPFILRFLKTPSLYFCLEPLRMVYEYSLQVSDSLPVFNKLYETVNRVIRKKIDQTNARSATKTLAISFFGREYMIHAYDLYPRISYLGVDTSRFKILPVKKKKQVLFVAEKEKIYGYDLATAAMEYIPKKNRPGLRILSWTKDPEKRLTDDEVVRLYNESTVTLSLSKYDTFGLIPLESMSCGTPVIALNVAGYRETMIDKKTGFLVEFEPKEIAARIMELMENPALAKKMGETGRRWVEEKWTWRAQIRELDHRLKELTSSKNK